jgi:hypothetical protein
MIAMRRKRPNEHADDFDHIDDEHLARLRSQLLRWATDNAEALGRAKPEMLPGLHNRASMNWRTLLAIAERAGGGWKRAAWKAVRAIEEVHAAADPELGAQLLSDIRDIFVRRGTDRMTTRILLDELTKDTEGPWAAYGKSGKPISDRQLFRLLKDFRQGHGIRSRNIRVEGIAGPVKGYLRADFEGDFASYISDVAAKTPSSTATPLQVNIFNVLGPTSSATSTPDVADENGPNPLDIKVCSGVAARNQVLAATRDDGVAESVDGSPWVASEPCDQTIAETAAAGASLPPEDRSCRHCDGPLDGTEQLCAVDGISIWLHPECQRPYLDRVCR